MKLSAKQIEEVKFTVGEKGYSAKEVDDFLDKVLEDYKEIENPTALDGDNSFISIKIDTNELAKIVIANDFDGELLPNTVKFEGTVAQWKAIKNKGIFEDIPCINCKDGMHVQRL